MLDVSKFKQLAIATWPKRRAQFSNAYGAMVHTRVSNYDLRENRVIDMNATESR
jgi:hypothetical protein